MTEKALCILGFCAKCFGLMKKKEPSVTTEPLSVGYCRFSFCYHTQFLTAKKQKKYLFLLILVGSFKPLWILSWFINIGSDFYFQHTNWKSHRQALLHSIGQFVERPEGVTTLQSSSLINSAAWEQCTEAMLQPEMLMSDGTPLLFLLDDNFFYPSMRYEVYQLARKCKVILSTNASDPLYFVKMKI